MPSEALELVASMVRGFPHKDKVDDDYFASIASILVRYPRSIAVKCTHPIEGVIREAGSFLPTAGIIVDWCEKAAAPLREEAAREARIEAQLKDREEWKASSRPAQEETRKLITYQEHLDAVARGETQMTCRSRSEWEKL
jgi:hypothetical protein